MKPISRRSFLERSGTGLAAVTAIPALKVSVQERAHLFAPPADVALVGGKVITVNARDEIVEAVAIKGNRIAAVGSRASLRTTSTLSTPTSVGGSTSGRRWWGRSPTLGSSFRSG
jgi:hypothetical protein